MTIGFKHFLLTAAIATFSIVGRAQSATDGMVDAINQMSEDEVSNIQDQWEHLDNLGDMVSEGIGHLNTAINLYNSASELYNASQALDNNECVPDFSTDAQSMMPTGCSENAACASCYEQGINNLTVVRRSLARMSCIRMNTKRFNEAAIAFGDNVAGIHAVTGLAWQQQRAEILQTFDHFNHTYDQKYTDLMASLQNALHSIDRCESQFGMRDWYQRFGFIYFEMMKEKYKRTD